LQFTAPNHYATLGLDHHCTDAQVRAAYRLLAKQHHPDLNHGSPAAVARTQALNAAYEILSDPALRRLHDAELLRDRQPARTGKSSRLAQITQDVHLRLDEFFRGTTLDVRVNDPAHPGAPEVYSLVVPTETAPGTRFKIGRTVGGCVIVRLRVRPDHRFKARGSDLRCDLRISPQRAAQGGVETIPRPTGTRLRVTIPRQVARGSTIRISGEGLPRPRGGRGDLLVRVLYRPEVRISRASRR
jgi:DnaJ-class molecular chaperone